MQGLVHLHEKYMLFDLGFTQKRLISTINHNLIYAPAKVVTSTGLRGDEIHYMAVNVTRVAA